MKRKIERVQYDGSGEWLDVVFDDGKRARFTSDLVYELGKVAAWGKEGESGEDTRTRID